MNYMLDRRDPLPKAINISEEWVEIFKKARSYIGYGLTKDQIKERKREYDRIYNSKKKLKKQRNENRN